MSLCWRELSHCERKRRNLKLGNFGRVKNDGLPDSQSPHARDRTIYSRVVLVGTNRCLQHFGGKTPVIRIDVHHRAANISHRYGDGGCIVPVTESEHTADPLIFLKGYGTGGSDNDVRTKSPDIRAPPRESADLANCIGGDHGDTRGVENTVLQLHHLHGGTVAPPDLCGQIFSEQW